MNKHILSFLLLFFYCNSHSIAQTVEQSAQIKTLHKYVDFTNESIHGMLIIHRMLENFNQEVNKYVDLESNQLNFYGNKDLPKNIFQDPDHWFYPVSPLELHEICQKSSKSLPNAVAAELNAHANQLKAAFSQVNNLRFEIDDFISNNDLTITANQTKIYRMLERGVYQYDAFFQSKESMGRTLDKIQQEYIPVKSTKFNQSIDLLVRIHQISSDLLESLRFGYFNSIPNLNTELSTSISKAKSSNITNPTHKKALEAAEELLTFTKAYLSKNKYSDKYIQYGKEYFYYNVQLASSFNRYGSGMVKLINEYIQLTNPSRLKLLEQPHYYKVVYPKKEISIEAEQPLIDKIPAKIKDREVVVKQQKIDVDNKKLLLEIYDHKEEDGDIISLNFNGNWILNKRKIEKRALKILVELNEEGENYIILHAENLGDTPPNTIAIRYQFEGKRQFVVLNSDLNESELIRINYLK